MPSEKAHLAVAQRNQHLIDHLLADPVRFPEWIATAVFYRALHLVEAVFSNDPNVRHARTHEERERILKSSRKYSGIYKHYRPIWSASLIARYLEDSSTTVSSFAEYMSPADVKAQLLDHYLRRIESTVEQLLGYSIRPTPAAPPPAPQ